MEAKNKNIPYIVYEAMLEKEDRQQRRMVVIIILLVVLLVASNALWVYEWTQYDYVDEASIDVEADEGGNANYIGRDGEIINADESESNKEKNPNKEEGFKGNEN